MSPQIILYSYETTTNTQKTFQFLALFKIPFKYVQLPEIMPRPELDSIGVTYRRVPLLSIDSDMYVDNALIIEKLSDIARHSDCGLDDAMNHVEYDALGQMAARCAGGLIPPDHRLLQDKKFMEDRSDLRGAPFNGDVLAKARPQTISDMLTLVSLVESHFLRDGRQFFLGGRTPTTADMHLYWGLNWGLRFHHGARPELSESSHPKIFEWLMAVESFIKDRRLQTTIDMADAREILQVPPKHEYAKFVPHVQDNPDALEQGQKIRITPTDTGKSGPQVGTLLRLNYEQLCLRNEKGLVMHFPRLGYVVEAV